MSLSKWIDLRQPKNKTITGPFDTYHPLHFTSRNVQFLWYLSVISQKSRTSHQPPGRCDMWLSQLITDKEMAACRAPHCSSRRP